MNYSAEEKAELLEGWRLSGKSISAYVKEKGLVRWTFTKWIKAERETKSCFVEVPAHVLKPVPHLPEILIEKGDIKIHVPLGMGGGGLRAVMEGLGVAL
jgi:transposase-like protein